MSDESCIEAGRKMTLLPCAHCGGEALVHGGSRSTIGHGESAFVARLGCNQCGVHVSVGGRDDAEILTSIIDAITVWNERTA